MQWFRTKGDKLIQKEFLTFRQWTMLNERILGLNRILPCSLVAHIHLKILQKGALSLIQYVEKGGVGKSNSKRNFRVYYWYQRLMDDLKVSPYPVEAEQDPFGLESSSEAKNLRWQAIEYLIPVAQALKNERLLHQLAWERHMWDGLSIQRFIKAHTNW